MPRLLATLALLAPAHAGAPADRLPDPRPEPCVAAPVDLTGEDDEFASLGGSQGLAYEQVVPVLQKTIQTALYCGQPEGFTALRPTFLLTVGCDGVVSKVEVDHDDGAPDAWLQCVSDVLEKADFPAHDMPDGMPVTYPVSFAW